MPVARIPLAGSLMARDYYNYASRDQLFTNCFSYEVGDQMTGGKRIYLLKRSGFTGAIAYSSATSQFGACVWQSAATPKIAFSYINGTTGRVYDQTRTQIGGDISNVGLCLYMTDTTVSGTGTLVGIFADSGTGAYEAWYYPDGGAWTQITDGDFPSSIVGGPAHMDGFMFIMDSTGKIWNSDINSVSSWTANNYITASSMPDAGVGVARVKDAIAAFGPYSIEFFRNAGNASGSPLAAIPDSVVRIGAKSGTIRTIGDATYFQGVNAETSKTGIYRVKGVGVIEKISPPSVDEILNLSGTAICIGGIKTPGGHEHLLFYQFIQQPLLAYCITNDRWWLFSAHVSVFDQLTAALGLSSLPRTTYMSATVPNSGGAVYVAATNALVYQDNGVVMTMNAQTMPLDFGTDKPKFASKLRLIGDKSSSSNPVTVSWSDDDCITFSSGVNIDMSSSVNFATRLGSFKRRAFKFTNSANLPLRLEAFELEYEVGA